MNKIIITLLPVILMLLASISVSAAESNPLRNTNKKFFTTEDARIIGNRVVLYQRITGGWPKNIKMWLPISPEDSLKVISDKNRVDDSTCDNNATTMQMKYLASLYQATGDSIYSNAFNRGLEYLLGGQYPNGGWPQFWPNPRGYQVHITYNDNAMTNILLVLRDIFQKNYPYDGDLISEDVRDRAVKAFDKGIDCILATQIRVNGVPTVWCQQHDHETFAPASARKYELASFCSLESVGLVYLLMDIPDPDDRVKQAIHGAMKWFESTRIDGKRYIHGDKEDPNSLSVIVDDPDSPGMWARYYDLENCRPFVCDRDGIPRESLDQIGRERRNGYGWYNDRPANLFPLYEQWKLHHN